MKSAYYLLILLGILAFTSACETTEKIDDFPLRPSKLVVNCFFSPDSIWEIQVSHSLSVLDNGELAFIDSSVIYLFEDDQLIDSIVKQDQDGWYRLANHQPLPDRSYSIEVKAPDFDTIVRATDIAPSKVPISNLDIVILDSVFNPNTYHFRWGEYTIIDGRVEGIFGITINDPGDEENYYQLSMYTYDTLPDYSDSTKIRINKNSILFNIQDATSGVNEDRARKVLISDEVFNGQSHEIKVEFTQWGVKRNSKYFIELVSLTRNGYLYRTSVERYQSSLGDPFSEPVQIYGNIDHGFGIFAGFNVYIHEFYLF